MSTVLYDSYKYNHETLIRRYRVFFNIYTGGAKAPSPFDGPPLNGFGPPSKSPFWSENE